MRGFNGPGPFMGIGAHHFHPHSIGQDSVTQPPITAKDAGKCSPAVSPRGKK